MDQHKGAKGQWQYRDTRSINYMTKHHCMLLKNHLNTSVYELNSYATVDYLKLNYFDFMQIEQLISIPKL